MYNIVFITLAVIATSSAHILPNACQSGELLPHEADCTKLYVCMNGLKIELQCVAGTWFDSALKTCVPMTAAGCTLGSSDNSRVELSRAGVIEHVSDTSVCPEGFLGNVPDPNSCNSYYLCVGSTLSILLLCPVDFEFDPVAQTCVQISEGGCTLSRCYMEKSRTNIIQDISVTSVCPDGYFGVVPNPDSCTSFYICVRGTAILLHCAENTEYDPVTQTCVPITIAGCTLGSSDNSRVELSRAGAIVSDTSVCPEGFFGNVPDPNSCNSYYICLGSTLSIFLFCPVDFEFDPVASMCVPISEGGCTLSSFRMK